MSLRYILGGAGTGKTSLCYKEITEESPHAVGTLIYIVPEQFSLEAERNLINSFAGKSIMKVQVLSFERLAYHMFSETGIKKGAVLDSTGKAMLIRKIIYELAPGLTYYKNTNVTTGFIDNISLAITEFHEYNISPEALQAAESENGPLNLKLKDIALIYGRYLEYISENFISTDETLDLLSERIEQSHFLEGAKIWVDNFSGFTPQEYKVLTKLMKKADMLTICLTIKSQAIRYQDIFITDIFYETKNTLNILTKLAEDENIKIEEPAFLEQGYRFQNSPEIGYVEKNFHDFKAKPYEGENNKIELYKCKNRYDECKTVCDAIVDLTREKGYEYSQIAVLTGDLVSYENIVGNLCARYELPCFIDTKVDVLSHPLSELIRGLLEIVIKNWSYESVFRTLKTGMTSISNQDMDILENYVIAHGIRGSRWKNEEWLYGFGDHSRFDKDKIHQLKENVYGIINNFTSGLTPKAKLPVNEICAKIYSFLITNEMDKKLAQMCDEAQQNNNMLLYRRHNSIWGVLIGVLEKMSDIFGSSLMSITEFSAVLDAGLGNGDMGMIPPTQDQIIIGDIYRSRLSEIKALFVVGAVEGAFPRAISDAGLFDDDERTSLVSTGIALGPDSIRKTYIDNYLIYTILTKASDLLVITSPVGDLDGKMFFQSPIFTKIEKLLKCQIEENSEKEQITMPRPMLDVAGKAMQSFQNREEITDFQSALIDWYSHNEKYSAYIEALGKGPLNEKTQHLSQVTIDDIYSKTIKTNVSRLEKYVECPFAFFVQYNLLAKERQIYQVARVDLGNLFHDVLEEFSRLTAENNIDWATLDMAAINSLVDIAFETLAAKVKSDVFSSDSRSKYVLERTKRIAKKSIWALCKHIESGSFVPLGAEVDFGITSPVTAIAIDINDQYSFTLTGRIDRIDILDSDGNAYVKIIDYKSGNKKFDITDIYYGMQLQLLLYMNTLVKNGAKILDIKQNIQPGGIFYFKIDDPIIDYEGAADSNRINKMILDKFKMSGIVLHDKNVIEGMDAVFEKNSPIIPVSVNAAGEYTSRSGALVNKEDFNMAMEFAMNKVQKIGAKIISGDISATPYKKGIQTGCAFCGYNAICGFDQGDGFHKFNIVRKKKNLNELRD